MLNFQEGRSQHTSETTALGSMLFRSVLSVVFFAQESSEIASYSNIRGCILHSARADLKVLGGLH